MPIERLDRVTEAQREVLRLVMQRMTAKEIARVVGISEDAVEGRLRTARATLGVSSSAEAARLVAQQEHGSLYNPSVYGPSEIVGEGDQQPRGAQDQPDHGLPDGSIDVAPALSGLAAPTGRTDWPWPTRERPRNDLSLAWRLVWPLLLIAILAFAVSLLLSSFAAVSAVLLGFLAR